MRRFLWCIGVLCFLLGSSGPSQADEINVSSEFGVYGKVDTVTGTYTQLGAPGILIESMTRVGAGTLFGMDNNQNLRTINPNNGSSVIVGFSGNGILAAALRPNTLTLFGVGGAGTPSLYTINQGNGATTLVGPLGLAVPWYNIAFDGSVNLFMVNAPGGRAANSNLYSISTTTGAATLIGAVGQSGNNFGVDSLTFSNGVLYGFTDRFSVTGPQHIITINPLTGAGTDTGLSYINNGFSGADSIFASAPITAAVPEPSTIVLSSLTVVGFVGYYRISKKRRRSRNSKTV